MIEIRDEHGLGTYYLAAELIEVILELRGNKSEIRTTTNRVYTSIESKETLAQKINRMKMSMLSEAIREK